MTYKITIEKQSAKEAKKNMEISFNGDTGIITPTEISELQGSLQELNNDTVNNQSRTSGIDLRTRLHNTEIASITVLDTLVAFNFLPMSIVPFTLQKKRLNVSINGKGREEIVELVAGKREKEQSAPSSFFGNLFKKKDSPQPPSNNMRGNV
jgi:hypothetical protein